MRFPTARFPQVRREVAAQISQVPGARRWAMVAIVCLVLGSAANIMVPIQLGHIVDLITGESTRSLQGIAITLVCAAITAAGLSALGFYILSRITERIIANLRESMVSTALGLPVHRVEDAGSGDLVSRSTDDVAELSAAVTETVPVLTTSVFSVLATGVALISLDWQYLAVIAVVSPIYYVAARRYLSVAPDRYSAERQARAERADQVLETIRGRDTVRAYALEQTMHDRVNSSSRAVADLGYRARRTMMVLQLWMTGAELTMLVVGLVVGYHAVATGDLTVGAVTGAMLMLIRLRGPLLGLMRVLDTVQSGYASLARIVGVVIDPPQPLPPIEAPPRRGQVDMDGVSFAYPGADAQGQRWAVEDIDLHIAPGETVAIVGASGAGKTTVAALLAGLRIPDSGSVRIDGVEVTALPDAQRVARLALVSQEVHVFSGTLREDLTLAKPGAADEELLAALEAVQADWFDELIDGLDTEVGAQGMTLDPVAAQQLALARILLVNPKVIIMDEATAEAGSSNAGALEAAAAAVTRGRTAVVIAHRLNQARHANVIVVMDSGRVVERGTHEQLLALGERYAQLWDAWQRGRGE